MLKTLYAKLIAVLVGLSVLMGAMFLIVIRHSDVARNQEINQKLYRNLAHRLIDEQILGERDSADPTAVQRVFDRIRVVNPRIDVPARHHGQGRRCFGPGWVEARPRRSRTDTPPVGREREASDTGRRSFGRRRPARLLRRTRAARSGQRGLPVPRTARLQRRHARAAHQAELRPARNPVADCRAVS